MQNNNLFAIDDKKLLFCIDEEVDRANYRRLNTLIEKNGGINQNICSPETINLITIKNNNNFVNKRSNYKLYNSQFIHDSIEKNCLQSLEDYRIPECIMEKDNDKKEALLNYPSLENTIFSGSKWLEPICRSEDVILESYDLDDDDDEDEGEDEEDNNVENLTTNPVDPEPVLCEENNIDKTSLKNTDKSADDCVGKPVASTSPKQIAPSVVDVALPEHIDEPVNSTSPKQIAPSVIDVALPEHVDEPVDSTSPKQIAPSVIDVALPKHIDEPVDSTSPKQMASSVVDVALPEHVDEPVESTSPKQIASSVVDVALPEHVDTQTSDVSEYFSCKNFESNLSLDDRKEAPSNSPIISANKQIDSSPEITLVKNPFFKMKRDRIRNCRSSKVLIKKENDLPIKQEVDVSMDRDKQKHDEVTSENIETKKSMLKTKSLKNTGNDLKVHSSKENKMLDIKKKRLERDLSQSYNTPINDYDVERESLDLLSSEKYSKNNMSDKNTTDVIKKITENKNSITKNNGEILNEVTSTTNSVSSVSINKPSNLSNDKSTRQENQENISISKDSDDSFVCNSQDEEETTSKRLNRIKKLKRLEKMSSKKSTGTLNIEKNSSKALGLFSCTRANDTIDKPKIFSKKKTVKIRNAFDDNFEINTSNILQRNNTQSIKDKVTNNLQDDNNNDDTVDGAVDDADGNDKSKKLVNNEKLIVKSTTSQSNSLAILLTSESANENSDKETTQLAQENRTKKRKKYHHETLNSHKHSTPVNPPVRKLCNRVCTVVPTPPSSSDELDDEYSNTSKRHCVDKENSSKAEQLKNNLTQTKEVSSNSSRKYDKANLKTPRRYLNDNDEEENLDELTNSFCQIKRKSKKNISPTKNNDKNDDNDKEKLPNNNTSQLKVGESSEALSNNDVNLKKKSSTTSNKNSMPIKSSKDFYLNNLEDDSDDENETSKLQADKETDGIIVISDSDDEKDKQDEFHSKNNNTVSKKLKITEKRKENHLKSSSNDNSRKKNIKEHQKTSNEGDDFVADSGNDTESDSSKSSPCKKHKKSVGDTDSSSSLSSSSSDDELVNLSSEYPSRTNNKSSNKVKNKKYKTTNYDRRSKKYLKGIYKSKEDKDLIIDRKNDPYRRYPTEPLDVNIKDQPRAWLDDDNKLFFRTDFDRHNHSIPTGKRPAYKEWEENEMIRFIYEKGHFHHNQSINIWNELVSTGLFIHRGSYSLMAHWKRMFETQRQIKNSDLPNRLIERLLYHFGKKK
ncbi:hypothetical protein HCN44_002329 [Aphidius gifuensis]|uniref:BRCT domain-containing protein n=1 Tax=Aphidius gifuensis TaxID=684658 RepID=A0A834Y2X7_APHGI|nr:hypothetical protein HCN44_002329 [Aphidius gifuensis]